MIRVLRLFALGSLTLHVSAAELHVSPDGDDANPGSAARPVATLGAARDAARPLAAKGPVTVIVADGTYYLPETLVFDSSDSGVIYQAANEGMAVLSGGLRLDLAWKPWKNGIFQAETPAGLAIDQVFIDGTRQRMARYPNYDPAAATKAYQGFSADAFSKERAAKWKNPAGGYIHAMHASRWGGYHYRITGKDAGGNITYEGGWQNNRQMGMHKEQRMVENIFEELDAPGEWFHDPKTRTLFYQPNPGEDLAKAVVEVVRLPHLIEFQGGSAAPVKRVTLQGFTFRHTTRTFMETKEPLLRSDWTIYRGGAIKLTGTEDVSILDCEFDQPGGNAIFFSHYNRRGLVKGCHIHDTGASGVCFVGDPDAVRNPLFEYNQRNDLETLDLKSGPKTDNFPADCAVVDCLIHGIGRVERQPAGVQISMSARIAVRDCSIYDCARSGINVSEGTWGGHLIDGCDVFDTVLETHDHGSFNSWGRDRFWHPNPNVTNAAVLNNPELPYLDARETTIIRNSRWRCDHGWDIDLDDGSSNYEIHNNLLLHGGLKFREGYGRKAYNNVIINNGFHPHVWYRKAASSFQRNIVMAAHADIRCAAGWTDSIDSNFYTTSGILERNRAKGGDAHSTAGDPKFLDPAKGDFRVADDSPALATGFKNFPMDRFGVKKPSLKAIAATPEISSNP
ncbi:MAG: right-handed parallel beta-helix repeat-containing protein [Akkermansiaceae bacterium]|nr:right-handed parallel beta-helix repeat-containing protein [Akkermansiaceae bacterium]